MKVGKIGVMSILALRTERARRTVWAGVALIAMAAFPAHAGQTETGGADAAQSGKAQQLAVVAKKPATTGVAARPLTGEGLGAYLAGRQARKDGDTTAAAHYYAIALAADPDNERLARRAFVLDLSEGLFDRAIPLARRVLKNDEAAPVANLAIAIDDIKHGRYAAAEDRVARAAQRGAMRLVGPLLRAWAAYGAGDMKGAFAQLDALHANETFKPFEMYHRALLNGASGNPAAALEALDALPEGATMDLRTRLVYAALVGMRDGDQAADAYLKGLSARYGEDPVLRAYLHGGRPIAQAFPVADAQDGAAEALYGAASALAQDSVNDVSLVYLRLALHIRPDLDVGHALLGDMQEESGRWPAAMQAYRQIDEASPYKWAANIRIAWALDTMGRTDEAIELLRQMADQRRNNITTLATLADVLRGHRRFGEAAAVYAEAIDRIKDPGARHWSLFYARGIALERMQRWPQAESDLLRALELNPNQPLVMNYLGYSWADKGMNLDKAVSMISRAVDLRPTDGYIVDSLGWAYFQIGDYQNAVKHLERAAELRPGDPTINDHLGDALWHVGRKRESCYQWRHALRLESDAELSERIAEKLDNGLAGDGKHFRGCSF